MCDVRPVCLQEDVVFLVSVPPLPCQSTATSPPVCPQWPCRQRWYLVYRVVASVLLTSWAIGDVAYETHEFYGGTIGRWFIFATNWSFLLLTLTTIFQALISGIFVWKHHWIVGELQCVCVGCCCCSCLFFFILRE